MYFLTPAQALWYSVWCTVLGLIGFGTAMVANREKDDHRHYGVLVVSILGSGAMMVGMLIVVDFFYHGKMIFLPEAASYLLCFSAQYFKAEKDNTPSSSKEKWPVNPTTGD